MTNHSTIDESLPLPITQKAIRWARQFASEQCHPHKKEQIYLNTLAVLAVRNYLKILDIETDLSQCDSWNPAIRLFDDVADLYVKGLGKIECRPIRYAHLPAGMVMEMRYQLYLTVAPCRSKLGKNVSATSSQPLMKRKKKRDCW
ncbi:MAG: DUF1822 family protein, partial [Microcoleus sp. SM1_3_4]|nr:DUF1822 family protein [Microcoleus sp. SM1_3_4]